MNRRFSGLLVLNQRFGFGEEDIKPIRRGTLPALKLWANSQGFEYVREIGSIFGGYWRDKDGNTYEVDVR